MFIKTDYSILGATAKPKDIVTKLKEFEYKTAIISDDNLFGTLEFYYECRKQGIMPIISTRIQAEGVHFILIAENSNGYKNLSRLSKYEEISLDKIKEHSENVFVIIDFDNLNEEAMINAKTVLINVYGGIRKVVTIEDSIKDSLIRSLNLKLIPVETALYINKEDYRAEVALRAIKEKSLYENFASLNNEVDSYVKERSYFIKTYPNEIKNLIEIISKCVDDYKFGNPTPPKFKFTKDVAKEIGLSEDISEDDLFAYLSRKGLEERLLNVPAERHDEYKARLEFEIAMINKMKFPGYMLIVWDFTNAAKQMKIPVGPGRGSAAGSLVAYALKITNLDPMPYGLLFERFLNPDRISMPDIDMDFCQSRREEIIQYVINKYGVDNVAQIITFGQMGGKSVIKDAGRILSYPLHLTEKIAKIVPETPGVKLSDAYDSNKTEFDAILSDDTHALRVWNLAKQLESTKRNLGVHAAGLVISDEDITERCPKYKVGDTQVVQYEGKYLEDVNLIKFDFLGLKTLSVIDEAVKLIKEHKGIDINIDTLPLNDKGTFDFISTGETKGMFQIESAGMQSLCRRLKPDCFEDLIAILALYRPGPMESGMLEDFIQRKRGEQKISYFFDDMTKALEPILKPTYGVIVYQEQVMQIVQEIGGFSLGESDVIRRAMGKKQIEYMNEKAEEFSDRASKKGYKKEEAKELFGLIEKFAGYGFNKSHSAAYALVTYITAYLKTYYPVEFMTALMNFDLDKHDKLVPFIQEVQRMGIVLHRPNINTSTAKFSIKDGEIVYGLKAIKGVGSDVDNIIEKRKLGYDSIGAFIKANRSSTPKMNKRVFTGLLYSGALDKVASRHWMEENIEFLMKISKESEFEKLFSLTEDELFKKELPLKKIIESEKEVLGHIYANPFEAIQKGLDLYDLTTYSDFVLGKNRFVGWIESKSIRTSKKGTKYGKFVIIDTNKASKELLIFEKSLNVIQESKILEDNKPFIFTVSYKDEDSIFIDSIEEITKSKMDSYFPKKEKEEVVATSQKVELGDFQALLKIEGATKLEITQEGKTLFIIN